MNVHVQRYGNSILVLDQKTNDVICQLPNIMQKENMPQILKAISIMLKEMAHASRRNIREVKRNRKG